MERSSLTALARQQLDLEAIEDTAVLLTVAKLR